MILLQLILLLLLLVNHQIPLPVDKHQFVLLLVVLYQPVEHLHLLALVVMVSVVILETLETVNGTAVINLETSLVFCL